MSPYRSITTIQPNRTIGTYLCSKLDSFYTWLNLPTVSFWKWLGKSLLAINVALIGVLLAIPIGLPLIILFDVLLSNEE